MTPSEKRYLKYFKENVIGTVIPSVGMTTRALGVHRSSYYQYRDRLFLKGYLAKRGSYFIIIKHEGK